MNQPRWRELEGGGSALIVCAFTWGDGHSCDQLLGRGYSQWHDLQPPKGYHYAKADDAGVVPLLRNGSPRRPMPFALQPRDNFDQPLWPATRWGLPTGVRARWTEGEKVKRPVDVRCPHCKQIRHID